MHIALIRQHFDRSRGGAEAYAVQLAHGLRDAGHRVSVVCMDAARQDAEGIELRRVIGSKCAGPFRHLAFGWLAGRRAARLRADAVIALARAWPADVLRLGDPNHHLWLRYQYPVWRERKLRERMLRHRSLLMLEERIFSPGRIGSYIANSEMVKRQMVHRFGVDPDRIQVLHNPVDHKRFSPGREAEGQALRQELGIAPDEIVVLFSGMEFRRKGLVPAARTFLALLERSRGRTDKLRFLVVGKGDPGPARELLARAGHADRMLALGPSQHPEHAYAASNVMLLPTVYDPAANAVGEAIACGTPVVTTVANGASELIKHGANGIVLASRDDTEGWAAAATQLLATERVQRSRAYVAMARRLPNWNDHLAAWDVLLSDLRNRKRQVHLSLPRSLHDDLSFARVDAELSMRSELPEARSLFDRSPVKHFSLSYHPAVADVIKRHNDSTVARIALAGGHRPSHDIFLPSQPDALYFKVRAGDGTCGFHEFEMCMECRNAGVETMVPLMASSNGSDSSFLAGEAGGVPLDVFLRTWCEEPTIRARRVRAQVLEALAQVAARFHRAGMHHQDFYANHLFVSLDLEGRVRIVLIDLARARKLERPVLRWVAKDLGQLHFSLASQLVSRSERLRFLRRYMWELGEGWSRRTLLAAILKRSAFIARRDAAVKARRSASDAALAQDKQRRGGLKPATLQDLPS